jgi:hypothetical protein
MTVLQGLNKAKVTGVSTLQRNIGKKQVLGDR